MTMHVNLSAEMENHIKSKVGSGFYGNATEVIRDAIRRMQAEEGPISAFRAAVAKGDAELDRGEGVAYTPELMESTNNEKRTTNNDPRSTNNDQRSTNNDPRTTNHALLLGGWHETTGAYHSRSRSHGR